MRVEPSRITDIGAYFTLQLGNDKFVRLAVSHPDAEAELKQTVDRLRPYLTQTESLKWRTDEVPKPIAKQFDATGLGLIVDLMMEYQRSVNRTPLREQLQSAETIDALYRVALSTLPPATDEPGVGRDGSLYYGAELGQIRVRRPQGEWGAIDTGTLANITAVEVTDDLIVAGTSSGTVRTSSDQGLTWKEAAVISAGNSIVDIDRVGDRWIIISASIGALSPHINSIMSWNLYSVDAKDFGNVVLVHRALPSDPIPTYSGITVRGVETGGNLYYVNGFTEVLKVDTQTWQRTVLRPPQSAVTRLSVAPDGQLIAAFLAQGGFSKLNISTDAGATWRALDTPSYPVYDVNFPSLDTATATRSNVGMFKSNFEWMSYDRAKDRWTKMYDVPFGCSRLLRDATDKQRFCLTLGGSILDRKDGRWVPEFAAE